ncbi:MAG: transcriptional regulator GcvA [Acidiferrobacterales bacterium]|nr:transcriptional regulator GcvA [Acidiferrobacterales bacterium]
MIHHLPPIAALRAFEASSRHLNFTKAAEELSITQSAVSHQIRHIEDLWDFKLFERQGRRLIITKEGQLIVPVIRDFLDSMKRVLNDITNTETRSSIRVSLLQSFAVKWLVPKLGGFNDLYPDIGIWISTTDEIVNFATEEVDVAIRLGYGDWPDLHVDTLLHEHVFPVCGPDFLKRITPPKRPADLVHYPLLYRHSFDNCPRWRDWFRDAGITVKSLPRGSRFPDTSMSIQAAIDNQGIALARSAYVDDDLKSNRLVKLFDVDSRSPVSYYFVCPHKTLAQPRIAAFRKWLLAEAAQSQISFDQVIRSSFKADVA